MDIRFVTPMKWILYRKRLLAFLAKHGDGRLNLELLAAISKLDPIDLGRPHASGTAAAVLREGSMLLGVAAAVEWGRQGCIVVTHPASRGQGIGSRLLSSLVSRLGKLSVQVAEDDRIGISLCNAAGLLPGDRLTPPSSKPVHCFEGSTTFGTIRANEE